MSLEEDLSEYGELIRGALDTKLNGEDSSFNNIVGSQLTANRLLVWLNEPSTLTLDIDFKNRIEQIITPLLFPRFVVLHRPGLNLVERADQPASNARALLFDLHYGLFKRLIVDDIKHDSFIFSNRAGLAIELMQGYFWEPGKSPHLAIQAVTRSGKTKFFEFLMPNCQAYSAIAVKNGAVDDGANGLVVIDPKIDPSLRAVAQTLGADYIFPDFSQSDLKFLDLVNQKLKGLVDIMHKRAETLKRQPSARFKDIWLMIDEGLAITALASAKAKAIYFALLDRLLLMSASVQMHVILSGQSFTAGKIASSEARLQFAMKILLAPKITAEQAQFLFKEVDETAINSLIIDQDDYGSLGVGIANNGDGNLVPFKSPYIRRLE